MTTAARPTFQPARGGTGKNEGSLSSVSKQYSSKDLPGHKKLKYRQIGQSAAEELDTHSFRGALEERERDHSKFSGNKAAGRTPYRVQRSEVDAQSAVSNGATSKTSSTVTHRSDKPRLQSKRAQPDAVKNPDADDPFDSDVEDEVARKRGVDDDEDGQPEDDADDDEEDDTAELMAELQRIKQERAVEEARREAERQMKEEKIRNESLLTSNPLLSSRSQNGPTDLRVKRRWDEDVVFKNCAKPVDADANKQRRYINDSIRSDFHRRFMEKFCK